MAGGTYPCVYLQSAGSSIYHCGLCIEVFGLFRALPLLLFSYSAEVALHSAVPGTRRFSPAFTRHDSPWTCV